MIEQVVGPTKLKFMSRTAIKKELTSQFGYADSAKQKNALKKALERFERKGDSYRLSKEMRDAESSKAKVAAKKEAAVKKAVAKKEAAKSKAKKPAKKAAANAKIAPKKAKK